MPRIVLYVVYAYCDGERPVEKGLIKRFNLDISHNVLMNNIYFIVLLTVIFIQI